MSEFINSLKSSLLIFIIFLPGFDSSDSDSSDCDMLPWQPDWFAASSDEEQGDDDEEE